jgi:alpha/beta superfamily hydrolase
MAHRIHQRLGATVICSSNPWVDHQVQQVPDIRMISQVATDCGFTDYSVYLIGISDGAYNNLLLAQAVPQVRKLLNINTSPKLRNNKSDLQDLGNRLQQLASIHKTLVYGTEDEEYCYVPYLKALDCDNLEILTVEGADHDFTGMVEEFIALTDLL